MVQPIERECHYKTQGSAGERDLKVRIEGNGWVNEAKRQ